MTDDLSRKAAALDVDRPLLVIMLMGGTGVGKSSLLNALAGSAVAQASFTRPTTRDPVVYFHQTVKPDRLDPALRLCRLVQHDRESLIQKVIVDTPDLDSNDIANRDKLKELLPVADVVLYVGSQEKYHDQLGWELFKDQQRRRAFAFVLNKWDRCQDPGAGLRPDEDLLRDLKAEGFSNPKLFRTTAQLWIDAEKSGKAVPDHLPPGEQFRELRDWLEQGLTRLEIEAVKARGVSQLIAQAQQAVERIKPPDLGPAAARTRTVWEDRLEGEAEEQAEVLLTTLEPYQNEVEHHFTIQGQRRFRGIMAGYLKLTTKLRYFSSNLRDHIPFQPRLGSGRVETPDTWNLSEFVENCSQTASDRVLSQRMTALANRLLVDADQKDYPVTLLADRTSSIAQSSWQERITRCLIESLSQVEREVTQPTGGRKVVRGGLSFLANSLPELVLVASIILILYLFFVEHEPPTLVMVLLPVYATLGTLVLLHVVIALLLPIRWSAIRGEFRDRLCEKLRDEFQRAFLPVPDEVALAVRNEKKQAEQLASEVQQVAAWLEEREQAAQVSELYSRSNRE
jgi:hypothetical protein